MFIMYLSQVYYRGPGNKLLILMILNTQLHFIIRPDSLPLT